MPHPTTCPRCRRAYQETSQEDANSPDRRCGHCWLGIRVGVRRASADLDSQVTLEQPPRALTGSRPHAFKGCGEGKEEGRPAADQAGCRRAERSAIDPAAPWPFDPVAPQTQQQADREWRLTAPEAWL